MKDNHKYKRRPRDYYEDAYEDRHCRDKYKHQYRDDSYDSIRSKSRERGCLPKARKFDNESKIKQVHKVI